MAYTIIMPKSGMAMEEGTVVRWLKKVGETIAKGEAIAVIETDKVTMELESDYEGTLLAIVHGDGEVVKATHTIGWVGTPGEKVPTEGNETESGMPGAASIDPAVTHAGATAAARAADSPAAVGKTPATPAARAFAAEAGIALSSIAGSGPGGAVRRETSPGRRRSRPRRLPGKWRRSTASVWRGSKDPEPAEESARLTLRRTRERFPPNPGRGQAMAFSGMRRAIAEKMLHSHQQVPAVTLVTRVDVTELAALRGRVNAAGGEKVSFTDFILRAAATALREHPLLNSVIEGDRILLRQEVNIGVAVALEAGLIVPVVRRADELGVRQIASITRNMAERARAGSLAPDDCAGGTFTITNLGMYGITEFTPLINVPESAILGVGAIEEAFRTAKGGGIESRKVMSLCLTHDHRHIDGAPAAVFLGRIKALLEDSYSLVG